MNEWTHVDLFSGIGGFALAARWNGIRTVAFCEREPYAQRVLAKNFGAVLADTEGLRWIEPADGSEGLRPPAGGKPIIYPDVRTFPGERYAGATLLTGGFPCQPFSLAGKRAGASDDRFLWPAMVAVIEAIRPTWIIGENVPGIISMELDRCVSDLEDAGYSCWPVVIPACAVDARHRRDRVWIVAHREQSGLQGHARHGEDGDKPGWIGTKARRSVGAGGVRGNVADATGGKGDGRGAGNMAGEEGQGPSVHAAADAGGEDVSNTNSEGWEKRKRQSGEGVQRAYADDRTGCAVWEPEPDVGRSIDGFSAWLDGDKRLTRQSHKRILAYVKQRKDISYEAAKERSREVLRTLRDSAQAQGVEWQAGGSSGIFAETILLAYLRQLQASPIDEAWIQLEGSETPQDGVRSVRTGNKSSRTPSRSRHFQQLNGEHPDTLQVLSRFLALDSQKAWQNYRWSNAATVLSPWGEGWEVGLQRVAHGIPARVDRLKGLGNAIVPQVAAELMRMMKCA